MIACASTVCRLGSSLTILLAVSACARSGAPAARTTPTTAEAPSHAQPAPHAQPVAATDAPGGLPLDATFLDLLRAIQARAEQPTGACLLRRTRAGFTVGAPLALATQGWPETPASLPTAEPEHRLHVLTRWGQLGGAEPGPLLIDVTGVPPAALQAPAVALLLDAGGAIQLLSTDAAPQRLADAHASGAALVAATRRGIQSLFVTATRDTPVASIAALLEQVPDGAAVAFAIALPPGSRMAPVEPPASALHASVCPSGLPAPAADAQEGDLDRSALLAALEPLQPAAADCMQHAGVGAAAGGRITLAIRIGSAGQVTHACLVEDGIGDATLAACLSEHARSLRFPTPTPAGFVDVHLPLALSAPSSAPLRAYCE